MFAIPDTETESSMYKDPDNRRISVECYAKEPTWEPYTSEISGRYTQKQKTYKAKANETNIRIRKGQTMIPVCDS